MLTLDRGAWKRRASASEGRSGSDRAERLDARPADSLSEEGPSLGELIGGCKEYFTLSRSR